MPTAQRETSPEALAEREAAFYDERGTSYDRIRAVINRAIGGFGRYGDMENLFDPAGKRVLDYGCGPGGATPRFVERGACEVVGFDVSEGEVEKARRRAESLGMADRISFTTADAHSLPFEDDAFDLVVGYSILHHLVLPRALGEIRRVLRPGGRAVFAEPLAGNPIIRLGRWLSPSARTPDEHPFTRADWDACARVFTRFSHREAEFLTVPLMPLNLVLPRRTQDALAKRLWRADDRLLERFPSLRPYARLTFLILE